MYSSRILSLDRLCSIFIASMASDNLRVSVFSFDRKKLRATCMVMVEAPSLAPPDSRFDPAARSMPSVSTPPWV